MNFLRTANFFLILSTALVVASLALMVYPGPNLSIDFTGGTLIEIGGNEIDKQQVESAIQNITFTAPLGNITTNNTQDGTVLVRLRSLSNEEHITFAAEMNKAIEGYNELQFTTIGAVVGSTMKTRSIWALIIASVVIVLYIAVAFRKIPRKYSAWRFGVIAVVTLLHDVTITVGVFVLLSHFTSFQFDTLFITALLTILGYSVNDTIIIFDRIRDNLNSQARKESFAVVANRSLNDSLTRSFNTSFSTLIMLLSLLALGSESIRWFVLTLIVGTVIGTYSSIFLATPLLVKWQDWQKN
jgi:preprotein translocase subunit SecF